MANSPHGGEWLSELIVAIDDLVFESTPAPPTVN